MPQKGATMHRDEHTHGRRYTPVRSALALGGFLAGLAAPASAQLGGQGVLDLSDLAGSIAKAVESAPAKGENPAAGVFRSGLAVPSIRPGETAREIGRQLRTTIEKQGGAGASNPALAQLEEGMPKALAGLEEQLEGIGFAKRDMGIAYAYAFLYNWETANGKTIPDAPSKVAARTVATAVARAWGARYAKLTPEAREKTYESLLVTTTLVSAFAQQFDKAGKTGEAGAMRRTAGQMFEKLTGAPASRVRIDADGRITGLSGAGASAAASTAANAALPPPRASAASGPLPAASLGGAKVFVKYSFTTYPSFQTRFDHLLLFPDGTAFADIPSKPLPTFSAAALKAALKPRYVGRWKQSGADTMVLTFPGDKPQTLRRGPRGWYDAADPPKPDSAYETYFPVVVPTKKTLLGAWRNKNLVTSGAAGGGTAFVAAGSTSDRVFNADGTFAGSREGFASATTANMGDAFKSGGDVTTYGKNTRQTTGRWRLDGPLLTTETPDGQRTVSLAFVLPNWSKTQKTDLLIQGDWWQRPEKD
jgi:hypothetical protein